MGYKLFTLLSRRVILLPLIAYLLLPNAALGQEATGPLSPVRTCAVTSTAQLCAYTESPSAHDVAPTPRGNLAAVQMSESLMAKRPSRLRNALVGAGIGAVGGSVAWLCVLYCSGGGGDNHGVFLTPIFMVSGAAVGALIGAVLPTRSDTGS
jgi:hypothetical protein